MKKTVTSLLFGLAILLADTSLAQNTDQQAITATINQLFEGMRNTDSTLVRAVFAPNARMQTVMLNKEAKPVIRTEENINGFVKTIGTPHKDVYDERIGQLDIKIDGGMLAQVWTTYEFWIGEKFSHCGVDIFTMAKTDLGWKIIYLADTRRKDCGK